MIKNNLTKQTELIVNLDYMPRRSLCEYGHRNAKMKVNWEDNVMDKHTTLKVQKSNQKFGKKVKNSPVRIIIKLIFILRTRMVIIFFQKEIDLHFFILMNSQISTSRADRGSWCWRGSCPSQRAVSWHCRCRPAHRQAGIPSPSTAVRSLQFFPRQFQVQIRFSPFSTVNFHVKWISFLCARLRNSHSFMAKSAVKKVEWNFWISRERE